MRTDAEIILQEDKNLYNLYEEASTPWEWHKEIIKKGKRLGLESGLALKLGSEPELRSG